MLLVENDCFLSTCLYELFKSRRCIRIIEILNRFDLSFFCWWYSANFNFRHLDLVKEKKELRLNESHGLISPFPVQYCHISEIRNSAILAMVILFYNSSPCGSFCTLFNDPLKNIQKYSQSRPLLTYSVS
jgi:hypothetical protein